jgi:hypothetical protein
MVVAPFFFSDGRISDIVSWRFAHIFMPVEEVGIGSHAHGVQAKHLFFLSFAFSSPGCRP